MEPSSAVQAEAKRRKPEAKAKASRVKDAGLNRFSEAQLNTVLNLCGVPGTSNWPKGQLAPRRRAVESRVLG